MGSEGYEVLIVSTRTGQQTKREWRASELLKGVAWLKRMNAQGGEIYLRPLDGPELLLADALNAEAVKDMHRQGLAPVVAVETNPGRFQAWVKLSDRPLAEGLRKPALLGLARVFPEVGYYGRLAGFTSHQVEPHRAGRQPYVLAHDATGKVAPAAQPYLAAIEQAVREFAAKKQRPVDVEKARQMPHRDRGRSR